MAPPVKVLYVGLQMPQNTFLALAIYMATVPLYSHYATTVRSWGPTPLEDQQVAGGIMWLGGDLLFLTLLILLVLGLDAPRRAADGGRGPAARRRAGGDPRARGAAGRTAAPPRRGSGPPGP